MTRPRRQIDTLQFLERLDRIDREALRLIYFDRLTQAEAAVELGIQRETVRRCVANGMRELARALLTR